MKSIENQCHTAHVREYLLVGLLGLASFTYVLGVMQFSPLLTSISTEFSVSESTVGQLTAIGGIVGTVTALAAAPWMQRYSRRRWLSMQFGLLVIAILVMAIAPTFSVLVTGRVIAGLAGGAVLANCFTAAGELVVDLRRRNRGIAVVASGTTLAILAGLPSLTLINDRLDWRWASASIAVPAFLVLAGVQWLPDRRPDQISESGRLSGIRSVLGQSRARWLVVVNGLMFLAYIGWITYVGAYIENDFASGARQLGLLFLVGGICELVANVVAPALFRRFSVFALSLFGAIGMSITLLGSGIVFSSIAALFVAISLLHVFTSFLYIGSQTLLIDVDQEQRGTVMALGSAASGLGGASGAFVAGLALASLGSYETTYRLLGAVMVLSVVCLIFSQRAQVQATISSRRL
ncbi:MFS transporter [soil metagenome]